LNLNPLFTLDRSWIQKMTQLQVLNGGDKAWAHHHFIGSSTCANSPLKIHRESSFFSVLVRRFRG
jgi:hypothetical protein